MTESHALPPLATDWPEMLPGWVWLAGAGPGDPGLLNLHALNALNQAEIILCDALVNPAILRWACPDARIISVGKRGGTESPKQAEISQQLVDFARSGARVLRLKGGDPFVFGRGGEEAQVLAQNNIAFRIIPGVSAGIGGLAYAGIPVTHNAAGPAVCFVTGHAPKTVNWGALAQGSPTIVIYMGMRNLAEIATALITAGRSATEPVALISDASLPSQNVLETRLETAAKDAQVAGIQSPAIICIGPVVALRHVLNWRDLRDLNPGHS